MSERKSISPWAWIGIGCAGLFVGVIAIVFLLIATVFGSIRASAPYRDALQRAQNDPRVAAALGTPIEGRWFVAGSINTRNRDGNANLAIPISGSKKKGMLHVVGEKKAGKWTYTQMSVTPEEEEAINLLEGSPRRDSPDE